MQPGAAPGNARERANVFDVCDALSREDDVDGRNTDAARATARCGPTLRATAALVQVASELGTRQAAAQWHSIGRLARIRLLEALRNSNLATLPVLCVVSPKRRCHVMAKNDLHQSKSMLSKRQKPVPSFT